MEGVKVNLLAAACPTSVARRAAIRQAKNRKLRFNFLKALYGCGNVRFAADIIGVSKSKLYALRKSDAEFARLWDATLLRCEKKINRNVRAVKSKLHYNGKLIINEDKYPEKMMREFLAEHHKKSLGEVNRSAEAKKLVALLKNLNERLGNE